MTVYVMRYASDGETSHINEAFTSIAAARKRFNQLKKEAEIQAETYKNAGMYIETPPTEMFDWPFEDYVRKYTIKKVADLIRLIDHL